MKNLFFLPLLLTTIGSSWLYGQSWSAVGTGVASPGGPEVNALLANSGDLYVGGVYTTAGGITTNSLAKWSGSAWTGFGTGIQKSTYQGLADAMIIYNNDLYVAGDFTAAGGVGATSIAKYDGTAWSGLGTGLAIPGGPQVWALAVYNGELYVGGAFYTAGGASASMIAKWNGTSWSAVGTGMSVGVYALAVYNGELYAGGEFTSAGGTTASRIAKWNGSTWSAVGTGIGGSGFPTVKSLIVYNGELYAGGTFTTAGGTSASNIAKWNGTTWSTVGTGTNNSVLALETHGGDLYAAGSFTTAGGVTANRIAKWNGTAWTALGTGVNGNVYALASFNGDLYAGGAFTTAGGTSANRIAKWSSCTAAPPQPGTISGSTNLCSGSTYTYSVAAVTGASSYSWTLPTGWTGSSTTNSITVTAGLGSGNLSVTAANGCGTSSSAQLPVIGNAAPVAVITPSGNLSFCPGDSVVLNAPAGTGYSYLWMLNNTVIAGATNTNYAGKTSGSYSLVLSSGGCADTSAAIIVNVYPSPAPVINIAGNVLSTAAGQGSYQWLKNATPIAGATGSSYTVTQNGIYAVRVTNGNACTGTSNSISVTSVGIDTMQPNGDVRIYPNPACEYLTIAGKGIPAGRATIRVTDVAGRMLHLLSIQVEQDGTLSHTLHLKSAAGHYFVTVETQRGKTIHKLYLY